MRFRNKTLYTYFCRLKASPSRNITNISILKHPVDFIPLIFVMVCEVPDNQYYPYPSYTKYKILKFLIGFIPYISVIYLTSQHNIGIQITQTHIYPYTNYRVFVILTNYMLYHICIACRLVYELYICNIS